MSVFLVQEIKISLFENWIKAHSFREEHPQATKPSSSHVWFLQDGEHISPLSIWEIISVFPKETLICHSGFVFRGWWLSALIWKCLLSGHCQHLICTGINLVRLGPWAWSTSVCKNNRDSNESKINKMNSYFLSYIHLFRNAYCTLLKIFEKLPFLFLVEFWTSVHFTIISMSF